MLGCTARSFLLTICSFQLVVVIECQVFDFLGFMYGPILANFLHIIFIILGFFGVLQYHSKYVAAYAIWSILWVGWCAFVICFYLDAGALSKDSDILSLGTGSRSWWEINGPGCIPDFTVPPNGSQSADPDPSRPPRPSRVDGCWMQYQYVETLQTAAQCLLSVAGALGGLWMGKSYIEDDDGSPREKAPTRPRVFTMDVATQGIPPIATVQSNGYASPRPMTPRRVKRRSIQARDAGAHTLARSSHRRSNRSRSSQRRRPHQSPVTKLLDQQAKVLEDGRRAGYSNPVFEQSSNSDINQSGVEEIYRPQSARSSYSNYHASRPISYLHNNEVFSNQAVAQVPINTNRSNAAPVRPRSDLPRAASSFLSQGPPAYREARDSETAI